LLLKWGKGELRGVCLEIRSEEDNGGLVPLLDVGEDKKPEFPGLATKTFRVG